MAFGWDDALMLGVSAYSAFSGGSSSASSARAIAEQNAANSAEAQKNRDWQERMSSTAHQREVDDLRKAGLNPILSATGGSGASSPGGSMAVMQNTQSDAAQIKAQMANIAANTAKAVSEARLNDETTRTQKSQQGLNAANSAAAIANSSGFIGNPRFGRIPLSAITSAFKSLTSAKSTTQSNLKSQGVKTWFN